LRGDGAAVGLLSLLGFDCLFVAASLADNLAGNCTADKGARISGAGRWTGHQTGDQKKSHRAASQAITN
jgi:hypothetical protein